jgi:hypothetical protein
MNYNDQQQAQQRSSGIMEQQAKQCGNIGNPKQSPAVGEAYEELAERIAVHQKLMDQLSERLEPILSPLPPSGTEKQQIATGRTCPLATGLASLADAVRQSSAVLASILDRLGV